MRIKDLILAAAAAAVLATAAVACGGDDDGDDEENLPACPSAGTQLTYESFGKPFFDKYCNSCHSAEGSARAGAPADDVFDTQAKIAAKKGEIHEVAAGSNPTMPPGGGPTDEERAQLSEWLSCGAK